MSEIIPAIIPKSSEELREQLAEIPWEIKLVHIDVLEEDVCGDFYRMFEAHLIVEKPERIIERWVKRGARRIIVHKLSPEVLKYKSEVEIGLGIEMHMPIEEVLSLAESVDFVQFMSIDVIGSQGHAFNPQVFDRIRQVKEKFSDIIISVDGGVNTTNYKELEDAEVSRLVVGSGFKELWQYLTVGK